MRKDAITRTIEFRQPLGTIIGENATFWPKFVHLFIARAALDLENLDIIKPGRPARLSDLEYLFFPGTIFGLKPFPDFEDVSTNSEEPAEGMYADEDLTPEDLAQMRRKEEVEAGRFDKVDAAA